MNNVKKKFFSTQSAKKTQEFVTCYFSLQFILLKITILTKVFLGLGHILRMGQKYSLTAKFLQIFFFLQTDLQN